MVERTRGGCDNKDRARDSNPLTQRMVLHDRRTPHPATYRRAWREYDVVGHSEKSSQSGGGAHKDKGREKVGVRGAYPLPAGNRVKALLEVDELKVLLRLWNVLRGNDCPL